MEATKFYHGNPIYTVDWRLLHINSHQADPDTSICSYFLTKGLLPKSITSTHIIYLFCLHATNIGFQRLGLYPHEIGYYSLLSGGAMTLHQAHIPDSTIKIICRWRSDAFLIYLQVQVDTSTKSVTLAMAKIA